MPSRRWEADRDGVEDYRALWLLRDEARKAAASGRSADANEANALIGEAVERVAGWQVGKIDEITRFTRPYEINFKLLLQYRTKIAEMILKLRGAS